MNAAVTISPEPGELRRNGNSEYYECVSMVVRDKAYFGGGFTNSDLNYSSGVNPGSNYKNGVKCGSAFITNNETASGYYLGKEGDVASNGVELDANEIQIYLHLKIFLEKKFRIGSK